MLDDDRSFTENLDAALHPSASHVWGRRIATLLVTLVAGAVVLALLFMRGGQFTPIIPQGASYSLLLTSDVTWGTFTITQGQHHSTFMNAGSPQASRVYVAPAALAIQFAAPPFAPLTCRLTLPPAAGDTCHGLAALANSAPDVHGITHLSVHFRMNVADLPAPMGQALTRAIDQQVLAITPHVSIPPGSHYAVGAFLIAHYIAQRPLNATLISVRGDPQRSPDAECPAICGAEALSYTSAPPLQGIWHARVFIAQQWRIRDALGTDLGAIKENTLPRPLDVELQFDTVTSQWSISAGADLSQGMCDDGGVFLSGFFFGPNSGFTDFTTRPRYDDHLLGGCRLRLPTTDGRQVAEFLWRLGGLYAVNAVAHTAAPSLAVATAPDVAALG